MDLTEIYPDIVMDVQEKELVPVPMAEDSNPKVDRIESYNNKPAIMGPSCFNAEKSDYHNALNMTANTQINVLQQKICVKNVHILLDPKEDKPKELIRVADLGLNFVHNPKPLGIEDYKESLFELDDAIQKRRTLKYDKRLLYKHLLNNTFRKLNNHEWPSYSITKNVARIKLDNPKLRSQKEKFVVIPTDKNQGPAVMLKSKYLDWMNSHLNNNEYYSKMEDSCELIVKTKLLSFMEKWKVDLRVVTKRDVSDSLLEANMGKFFGLPKIHKSGYPIDAPALRPIISTKGSCLHKLSKMLHKILWPYAKKCKSFVKDSKHIADLLGELEMDEPSSIITLDIENLYMNINTNNVMMIMERILDTNKEKDMILDGLRLILFNGYFKFDKKIYLQTKGIPMGHPVAPAIATIYLGFFENTILSRFNDYIYMYKRYLDDILVIFSKEEKEFNLFLDKISSIEGMKWNVTSKDLDKTPFLDLLIVKRGIQYTYKTYDKPLNLYAYPKAYSGCPKNLQRGFIIGLLTRYEWQNPKEEDFKIMQRKLYSRLRNRGYEKSFIINIFNEFLNRDTEKEKSKTFPIFLKIKYDPCRFKPSRIRDLYNLIGMSTLIGKEIKICYKKRTTIGNMLNKSNSSSNPGVSNTANLYNPTPISLVSNNDSLQTVEYRTEQDSVAATKPNKARNLEFSRYSKTWRVEAVSEPNDTNQDIVEETPTTHE